MKKTLLVFTLFFNLSLTAQVTETVGTIMDTATTVTAFSGGYTLVVVLLCALLVLSLLTIAYLYKQNTEVNNYVRDISKEAIAAVTSIQGVLTTVKEGHERLAMDHDKIKDGIIEIKTKMK